ncbi:MAG: YbhB/YbcL family Raf kinase inhibitor-like protein [Propionicimonas sp.]|nr:YbhB/YbcL family Raf kinase inhibitor-like protein [Propionicimonas sp.]
MFLRSVAVPDGSTIDLRHADPGVGGHNVSPDLAWGDAPEGTLSYLVTCFDPDAPTGSGWWHWVLTDIPAGIHSIPEGGSLPAGARAWQNDSGGDWWDGPYPPPGHPAHHYHFRVAALDVAKLDVAADAPRAGALLTAGFHVLADAGFVALFTNPAR